MAEFLYSFGEMYFWCLKVNLNDFVNLNVQVMKQPMY